MKNLPESNPLLAELLATPEADQFRSQTLQQVIGCAHTRRRARARNRLLKQAIAPILIASLAFAAFHRPAPSKALPFQLVVTQPLPDQQQVHTAVANMQLIETTGSGFTLVTTDLAHPVRPVSDQELLALFPGRPRALVTDAEGHYRLLFLDQAPPTE